MGTIYLEPNQPSVSLALIQRVETAHSGMQAAFFKNRAARFSWGMIKSVSLKRPAAATGRPFFRHSRDG